MIGHNVELSPEHITIAVTVYSRRQFVLAAIDSALQQTVPVKVIVVEDCGPDPTLQEMIRGAFGARIHYFRNAQRRGLFDNWNACMEYCTTPWLSILHDDDLLRPNFVEKMLSLARVAPNRGLYFARTGILNEQGAVTPAPFPTNSEWRELDPVELAEACFLMFPGQLFDAGRARSLGGFRTNSYLTGDWDMWLKLVLRFGGAQSNAELSLVRSHYGFDRGTSLVNRKGWTYALDNVQRKRNRRLLREEKGIDIGFERTKPLKSHPIPSRLLLRYACGFSKRMLAYNAWLFVHSTPPHWGYALLQRAVKVFGPRPLRWLSQLSNRCLQMSAPSRMGKPGSKAMPVNG